MSYINSGSGGTATPSTGGAASITTSGQGGFFGVCETFPAGNTSLTVGGSAASLTANNIVRGYQFVLRAQYKVSNIIFQASNPGGTAVAPVMDVGIYSADLSSLLLHSGAIDVSTTAVTVYSTAITPVTLNPGVYCLAYSGNATSGLTNISYTALVYSGSVISDIYNKNTARIWSKTSAATAGVLPSSISAPAAAAITASFPPFTLFEP